MDNFHVEVTSSTSSGMIMNKNNDFKANVSVNIEPGAWEVACSFLSLPMFETHQLPFNTNITDVNDTKITITTKRFTSNTAQTVVRVGSKVDITFPNLVNASFKTLIEMIDSMNETLMNVNVGFDLPFEFIYARGQLGIVFFEWSTNNNYIFLEVELCHAFAEYLQFNFRTGPGANHCTFTLPGMYSYKHPFGRYYYNVVPGIVYYTGGIWAPSTQPNALYDNPANKTLVSYPKVVSVKCNLTDNMLFGPLATAPKTRHYHRIKPDFKDLSNMHFVVLDENENKVKFQKESGTEFGDFTYLKLHFRKIGVTFEGIPHKDVVHKVV